VSAERKSVNVGTFTSEVENTDLIHTLNEIMGDGNEGDERWGPGYHNCNEILGKVYSCNNGNSELDGDPSVILKQNMIGF
jgi:hypothetical protein